MGCFKKDEAHDPEIFSIALIAVFCQYEELVVRRVSDPTTGISGSFNYGMPNIPDVKHACDVESSKIALRRNASASPRPRIEESKISREERQEIMARMRARYPQVFDERAFDRANAERTFIDLCLGCGVDPRSVPDRPGRSIPMPIADTVKKVVRAAQEEDIQF